MRYSRSGNRILLLAQTSHTERIELSGARVSVGGRLTFVAYRASVDLQEGLAYLVLIGELPIDDLISQRFPLVQIREGLDLVLRPEPTS